MPRILAALCLLALAAPVDADALDDERAQLQQQIAVLQARLDYLTALKAAGYVSVPPGAAPMTACSSVGLSACGANASVGVDASAGRSGPVRRFLGRFFGGRSAAGGCGG
jgi:hypothetical protein